MIDNQLQDAGNRFLADDYGAASFAEWAGQRMGVEIAPRDLKGALFEDAEEIVRSKAERQLSEAIRQAMEENLPTDADPSEWTWQALARWANERFELNLKEKDLKKYASTDPDEFRSGRDELEEFLNEKAAESLQKIDLSPAREFLKPDWGRRSLSGWVHHKFALAIDPATLGRPRPRRDHPPHPGRGQKALCPQGVRAAGPDRADPISRRPGSIPAAPLRPRGPGPLVRRPIPRRPRCRRAPPLASPRDRDPPDRPGPSALPGRPGRRRAREQARRSRVVPAARRQERGTRQSRRPRRPRRLGPAITRRRDYPRRAAIALPGQVRGRLVAALDARFRPEMREMEKAVLLQILDSSWMEHLRAMDHLRSSIGLQGYAQIDPKVEYKREGMRIFAEMWNGIGDRVTDLIFRVEQFDPDFLDYLGSRYNKLDRAKTIHQQAESQLTAAPGSGGVREQQEAAICRQSAVHREEA